MDSLDFNSLKFTGFYMMYAYHNSVIFFRRDKILLCMLHSNSLDMLHEDILHSMLFRRGWSNISQRSSLLDMYLAT